MTAPVLTQMEAPATTVPTNEAPVSMVASDSTCQ
jgi:hypothetical protein